MRRLAQLGWMVVLGACGTPGEIPADDFPVYGARVTCDRTRECMRGFYESQYVNHADCERTIERDLQALIELMDALECSYDAGQAADAYNEVYEMSCEDFYEGDAVAETNEIWEDCGGVTLPPYTTYTYYQ